MAIKENQRTREIKVDRADGTVKADHKFSEYTIDPRRIYNG